MKRFYRLVHRLVGFLLLSATLLSACSPARTVEITPTPASVPSTPTPAALPPGATTAARIRARGHLLVGVRYDLPPFGYVTPEGTLQGFEVDLGRELAQRWLGDADAVTFRQVRSDTALDHLQAGDVDLVLAMLEHSQQAESQADFSPAYLVDGQALLFGPGYTHLTGDLSQLAGLPVGVLSYGDAEAALVAALPTTPTLQYYDRFDQALEGLRSGQVVALADRLRRLAHGLHTIPGTAVAGRSTQVPVAAAYRQGDYHFGNMVALTLQDMAADGTYAALVGRWAGGEVGAAIATWPGQAAAPSLAAAPVVAAVPDTAAAIQARGRLVVAVVSDRSPFAYTNPDGYTVGYEISLAELLADRWFGDRTALEFVPATLENAILMVEQQRADLIIGGLSHSRERELILDFSLPVYLDGESLVVPIGSGLGDAASVAGRPVAIVRGESDGRGLYDAAQAAGLSVNLVLFSSREDALAALGAGNVAAIAGLRSDWLGTVYATDGIDVASPRFTQVPLALGLPQGDAAFRDRVNLTLQALKADGSLDNLYSQWFYDAPPEMERWPGAPSTDLHIALPTPTPEPAE